MTKVKFNTKDIQEKYVALHGGTLKAAKEEVEKVSAVIGALLEEVKTEGVEEVKVPLSGFGIFSAKPTEARTQFSHLANSGEGGLVTIPASVRISFKAAKALKEKLV